MLGLTEYDWICSEIYMTDLAELQEREQRHKLPAYTAIFSRISARIEHLYGSLMKICRISKDGLLFNFEASVSLLIARILLHTTPICKKKIFI